MLDNVKRCRFDATIAALSYWAPSIADVARIVEIECESSWTIAATPEELTACPFELRLRHDGHYRLAVAGEVYDDLPIETFELFVPLVQAVVAGNVCRRLWFSRLTGLLRGVGTVIELGMDRTWSAERQLADLPPTDPEDVIATDHYFAPYRR